MPTYQYACTECDHAFEQFQSFSDDALTVCPQCSGRLRKVFNAVGVVFKGSGFYRTDSRTTKEDSAPAADEKGAGDKAPGKKDSEKSAGNGSSGEKSVPSGKPGSTTKVSEKSGSPAGAGSTSAA
ncbi:MAG TPA: FmdB family zinc ribbon protein [Nocardioidaceae bacterium]|nr:FmdB family zinc ribbon protein [Nocardioidaceae bacterium]